MPATFSKTFNATTTGALASFGAAGSVPFIRYAVQVKGVGGVPTSWSVTLEGSLDNTNWTVLITHTTPDGSTQWESTGKPCLFVRANVGAVTLGPASSLNITATATS